MTRCAIQFFHGNFTAALGWNPLVFVTLCALFIFNIYAGVALVRQMPRLRIGGLTRSEKNFARLIVVCALACNWIYLLAHARSF
jgi:hypothetical protein